MTHLVLSPTSTFPQLEASASNPWPADPDIDDNLCTLSLDPKFKVTIIMGSDRYYSERVHRCTRPDWVPVNINSIYAGEYGCALRFYIGDDIPFIMKHVKNAMAGGFRKIFGMADAIRPTGPRYGNWTTVAQHINPDAVMWVDGDAHISLDLKIIHSLSKK